MYYETEYRWAGEASTFVLHINFFIFRTFLNSPWTISHSKIQKYFFVRHFLVQSFFCLYWNNNVFFFEYVIHNTIVYSTAVFRKMIFPLWKNKGWSTQPWTKYKGPAKPIFLSVYSHKAYNPTKQLGKTMRCELWFFVSRIQSGNQKIRCTESTQCYVQGYG